MTGRVFLTGDTHGSFKRIQSFGKLYEFTKDDVLIILGDVGLNYFGDVRDEYGKKQLSSLPCTFFCIHGNHEMRPTAEMGYHTVEYNGGKVLIQDEYPNILFPLDGEVFDFLGDQCVVIGGAYSVDKYYRLANGQRWWPDEQPSTEIKAKVEHTLEELGWRVDIVLSHTCPLKYEPVEVFLTMIVQSNVDKSTEVWLGGIEDRLSYDKWFCGHYHTHKVIDKMRFMFKDFCEMGGHDGLLGQQGRRPE